MMHFVSPRLVLFLTFCLLTGLGACSTGAGAENVAASLPTPAVDESRGGTGLQATVLAGGCFWGIEAVFEHVKGVKNVDSGYSGGPATAAHYDVVSTGITGHAESVRITYDPSQISYGQLLKVFFSVAHDPTQLNRQGPDVGTQYRSAVFYANDEQKRIAEAYIDQINQAKVFSKPIVTEVVRLKEFYKAEAYHQDYVVHHPDQRYIVVNDLPKLDKLRRQFPDLYVNP